MEWLPGWDSADIELIINLNTFFVFSETKMDACIEQN